MTLELGGKNPAVVARDADVSAMARRVMAARMSNGGQVCLCPDYVFVPREQVDTFVGAALDEARAAETADDGNGLVSIIDDKNYQRVTAMIDDARQLAAPSRTRHFRSIARNGESLRPCAGRQRRNGHRARGGVRTGAAELPYDTVDEVCATSSVARRRSPPTGTDRPVSSSIGSGLEQPAEA